ncbi:hypothetical protein BDW69DRAFT_66960 [Aspergillus filifer]
MRNNCRSAPHIWVHEVSLQDNDGIVPGGFIHYILMDYVWGRELNWDVFWSLSYEERSNVCDAFRLAWLYVFSPSVIDLIDHEPCDSTSTVAVI